MAKQLVKILVDCPAGRFKKGEIGYLLPNDFEKYDYFVHLEPIEVENKETEDKFLSLFDDLAFMRQLYFYKNEIELL